MVRLVGAMVEYIDDAIVVLMRCCGVAIKALKEVLDQRFSCRFSAGCIRSSLRVT